MPATRHSELSRTARITGALLLATVAALIVSGWRLYDQATRKQSPQSLGEHLIDALNRKDLTAAQRLLDHGADVRVKAANRSQTCLMAAADAPEPALIKQLLRRGADVNAIDANGDCALTDLFRSGHPTPELVRLLLPRASLLRNVHNQSGSLLAFAVWTGDPQILRILMAAGPNPNGMDWNGKPLLIKAVEFGDIAMTRELVSHGAAVKIKGPQGEVPLEIALKLVDDPLAMYLVAHGADINAPDSTGSTPLIAAAANNLPGAMNALLVRGANMNARNKRGETALFIAAREGRRDLVTMLLKHGAKLGIHDATTRTALAWAKDQGFATIEADLKAAGATR